MRRRGLVSPLLALAGMLALAACVHPAATPTVRNTTAKGPTPAATASVPMPAPSVAASPVPGGGASARPTPGASPSASAASPSPGTAASASPGVPDAWRLELQTKLQALAQVAFSSSRTATVQADLASRGVTLAADAHIVSDNGGGIIANNGGGIVSDNGGGVLSNNAGNFTAGGWHVLDVAAPPAIQPSAAPGEKADGLIHWGDGTATRLFRPANDPEALASREVDLDAAGRPDRQISAVVGAGAKSVDTDQILLAPPDESFGLHLAEHVAPDTAGNLQETATGNFHDPVTGVDLVLDNLAYDPGSGRATFTRHVAPFGLSEKGTITGLPIFFYVVMSDPLLRYAGDSEVDGADGKAIYKRTQTIEQDGHVLVQRYDLLDGFVITFRADDRQTTAPAGELTHDGNVVGSATRTFAATGEVHFAVTLQGSAATPIAADAGKPVATGGSTPPRVDHVYTAAGAGKSGRADGLGPQAAFNRPTGAAVRDDNTFFVADMANDRLCELDYDKAAGGYRCTTIAGSANGYQDGAGSAASFNAPQGVALLSLQAPNDALVVTDSKNNRIRLVRLDDPTHPVLTLAGGDAGYADGDGTAARFTKPTGVAVGDDGSIYVCDEGNTCLRVLHVTDAAHPGPATVTVSTLAGTAGQGGLVDGDGTAARFGNPTGLAFDAAHHTLWVADRDNGAVRAIDLATPGHAPVRTVVGPGAGDMADGPAATAGFGVPAGIAIDPRGNVLVNDWKAQRIRMIAPTGDVTTLACTAMPGPLDGPAQRVYGGTPWGLATFPAGGAVFFELDTGSVRILARPGLAASP